MSIIAINGKIGAGKDTVGKIIQYLCSVSYHKHDMSFNEFQDIFIEPDKVSSWKVKKYAKKLKEIASILTGIPIEKFEDQEFKKTFLSDDWSKDWIGGHKMTVRDLLQKLGTEAMRDGLHENVWVNALFADYNVGIQSESLKPTDTDYPSKWLITDLRFENEFQAVKDRNGICVRVNRKRPYDGVTEFGNDHPSEIALDSFTFDWEINNSGSIEDLVEEVRKMLINFKII